MCQKLWKLAGSRQSYCKNYQAYFFAHPVYCMLTCIWVHFEVQFLNAGGCTGTVWINFRLLFYTMPCENSKWKSLILCVIILLSKICCCLSENCNFFELTTPLAVPATSRFCRHTYVTSLHAIYTNSVVSEAIVSKYRSFVAEKRKQRVQRGYGLRCCVT